MHMCTLLHIENNYAYVYTTAYREQLCICVHYCMDDIMGSNNSTERTQTILKDAETIQLKGGSTIKSWMTSGESIITIKSEDQKQVQLLLNVNGYENGEKVLGLCWSTVTDNLSCDIKDSIKFNKMKVNKRIILSAINSIYDPLGLLSPFTVETKILMRKIWGLYPQIGWDDQLPEVLANEWLHIHNEIKEIQELRFTPDDAVGPPILIIFSDGTKNAYGAVAYCRWETKRSFESRIILAKSRIAPLKVINMVRLELWCGVKQTYQDTCRKGNKPFFC